MLAQPGNDMPNASASAFIDSAVREDVRPSQIMTHAAFENAIAVASALGASTNCPPHLIAIARHSGIDLSLDDWQRVGEDVPLLVNCMPAGEYLGESFHRAGGVPAVMHELDKVGRLSPTCRPRSISPLW